VKAEWTPAGGGLATLGDDSVKHSMVLEQIGGASVEQVAGLFRAAAVKRFPRGNISGECIFTSAKSHATQAAAMAFFKAEYARLNGKGSLVLTEGAVTWTMADAMLTAVQVVQVVGLRFWIRYRFGIATIS